MQRKIEYFGKTLLKTCQQVLDFYLQIFVTENMLYNDLVGLQFILIKLLLEEKKNLKRMKCNSIFYSINIV